MARRGVLYHLLVLRNKGISTRQHPPPPARVSEAFLFSHLFFLHTFLEVKRTHVIFFYSCNTSLMHVVSVLGIN